MKSDSDISELSRLIGIETKFIDSAGIARESPRATIAALLTTLGFPSATRDEVEASIERFHRRRAAQLVEPVVICREGEAPWTYVTQPASAGESLVRWEVETETGGVSRGEARFADLPLVENIGVGGELYERRCVGLTTALPLGYHRVRIETSQGTGAGALTVVPRLAYQPPALDRGRGIWGLGIQLYGLRSSRNWGFGDWTDLGAFLRQAAAAGAGAVSLNPLHALFLDDAKAASPYSPSSRLFLNPLYLDVDAIDDFAECAEAQVLSASADWKAALERLRGEDLVDYVEVTSCKLPILERLYQSFRSRHLAAEDQRARDFRAYQAREGIALQRFATYHALRDSLARAGGLRRSWREWPAEYRDPKSLAVARFEQDERIRIEFFVYLQWQCEDQLSRCAETARRLGMPIGLYHDLAVGVDANGAEAWADQEAIVPGWSIGAPPDPWNLKGQSWGLPPFNPLALRALAFRPLIETLRANMRHGGALRIDHILGFRRLFWIPSGAPPGEGVYVRYPLEEMIGILALESHRNRCLVIGEDLGTLPEGLREALNAQGIFSYRLLYFEREPEGAFHPPDAYPRQALAAVGTHDLPTLPGYWDGADIALKSHLGFYSGDEQRRQEEERRADDRRFLMEALRRAALSPCAEGDAGIAGAPPIEAAYRFLARTPSRLVLAHLEDALGVREQTNLPGTLFEHPNWRRRMPLAIDELFREPRVRALLRALEEERPSLTARTEP